MGAVFFSVFMLIIIVFCASIIIASFIITNKRIKKILRVISLLIVGLPVSWIIFLLFTNLVPQAIGIYFITINVFGILGNLLYKVYLNVFKKDINKNLSKPLKFFLYLSIFSDPFPILLVLADVFRK
jgi:cellulose synthase/poly-beta-1,6-N-acetylglucosamine synthase-like glycosyltransferase